MIRPESIAGAAYAAPAPLCQQMQRKTWLLPALLAILQLGACDPAPRQEMPGQNEAEQAKSGASVWRPDSEQPLPLQPSRSLPARDVIGEFAFGETPLEPGDQAALLAALRNLGRKEAIAQIRRFLASGAEVPTGQQFSLDAEAHVHSGLRALLLDELGRLEPRIAADLSRKLLDEDPRLPADVEAVALRNIAANAPDPLPATEHAYLRRFWSKIAERPGIISGTCPASLASLGLASFLRDESLLPPLFALRAKTQSPSAKKSIEQAIERLVLGASTASMEFLAYRPEFAGTTAGLRGRLLAHADLGHPAESEAVRFFLTDPSGSPQEIKSFVMHFPNESESLRPALFEPGHVSMQEELPKSYSAALGVVKRWQNDPSMQSAKDVLAILEVRLLALIQERGSVTQ